MLTRSHDTVLHVYHNLSKRILVLDRYDHDLMPVLNVALTINWSKMYSVLPIIM